MAAPRLPSVLEVFKNPKLIRAYSGQMLEDMTERVLQFERALTGATNVPDSPVDMALDHPAYQWMDAPHLHLIGDRIADAVRRTKEENAAAALLVTLPPRHAKSTLCSIWTPFWYLAQYPQDWVLFISYEADFAKRWGTQVRRLIELYGERYNMKLNPTKTAGDDWELASGGGMHTTGAGGSISGRPAQLLLCDDLVKDSNEARSPHQREVMWEWWETTVQQRIESDTTTVLIGTRWFEDDILGRVQQASDDGSGPKFDTIWMPAKAIERKPDDPESMKLPPDLLNRKPGEGLWTTHVQRSGKVWGQEYYDHIEETRTPTVWACVYQGLPTLPGGNMVDPAWWRFYRVTELPTTFDRACQSWDLSLDAEKKSDSRHAGLVLYRIGALIYIRAGFAEHCDINRVASTLRSWSQVFPFAKIKLLERATSGVALKQTMQSQVYGILAWPPKGRQKGSKEAELDAIIPAIQSGNVLLPLNPDGSQPKWVKELIHELKAFPRGQHDDFVDALSQGVNYLLPGIRSAVDQAHDEAKSRTESQSAEEQHTARMHAMIKKFGEPKRQAMLDHQRREDRSMIPFPMGFNGAGVGRFSRFFGGRRNRL